MTMDKGVPRDYAKAVKWYLKAAEQGFAPAQCNLGIMYRDGQGVPINFVKSYAWLSLASAQNQEKFSKLLSIIKPKMTPAQIAKAKKLAGELLVKIEKN